MVYWMNERSGRMKDIVGRFLNDQEVTGEDLKILKWYIWQWLADLEKKHKALGTWKDFQHCFPIDYGKRIMAAGCNGLRVIVNECRSCGIDPF